LAADLSTHPVVGDARAPDASRTQPVLWNTEGAAFGRDTDQATSGQRARSAAVGNAVGLGCGALLLIPILVVFATYAPLLGVPILGGYAFVAAGVIKGAEKPVSVSMIVVGALLIGALVVVLFISAP
jgi:hypothetical protein